MTGQICFCFGYSAEEIRQDVLAHGRSTIMARILAGKKTGGCRCAEKNPQGR